MEEGGGRAVRMSKDTPGDEERRKGPQGRRAKRGARGRNGSYRLDDSGSSVIARRALGSLCGLRCLGLLALRQRLRGGCE